VGLEEKPRDILCGWERVTESGRQKLEVDILADIFGEGALGEANSDPDNVPFRG